MVIRAREVAPADRTDTQGIADLEHAILLSATAGRSAWDIEVHIAELRAHSAEVDIIDVVTQNRPRIDPKTVLTSDKLDELVICLPEQRRSADRRPRPDPDAGA